ncbi:MAG TPA: DUF3592 domain-containing protein [Thermoanaerobaculia bacterium]|nr:DUF3592 domain-containing protein [Thermoanaerobaculia bacterium]
MPQKAVSRRALALLALLPLGACAPFAMQAWRDWRAFHDYEESRCTVLAIGYTESLGNRTSGSTSTPVRRHPELSLRYDTGRERHFAYGFDNMNGWLSDMSDASRFNVGETVPCWFDPAHPERAIVVRQLRPKFYAAALIPVFMLLVVIGMARGPRKTKPRLSGMLQPDFTARSRITIGFAILAGYTIAMFAALWFMLARIESLWFFAVLLIAAEVGIVRKLRTYMRARGLADARVQLDGSRAFVTLDSPVPLERVSIELADADGDRKTLFEKDNVSGSVRETVSIAGGRNLVVTQRFAGADIATEFALQ